MKTRPILRSVRPFVIAVIGLGVAAVAYSAGPGGNNAGGRGPIEQILALLTDPAFGLKEIKREIRAIEKALAPPTSLKLSSGSFGLPGNAVSVDWELLNNSTTTQTVTVTVFRVPGAGLKTVAPPGPLTLTIAPGEASHNANSVGSGQPFEPGFDYEVIVEASSPNVLPRVDVWADLGNTVIPGTLIPAGSWVRLQ